MSMIQESIDRYLEAVEQVYGPDFRAKTEVFASGGSHVIIKQPGDVEGEMVPIGHLELMTESLLNGEMRKAA